MTVCPSCGREWSAGACACGWKPETRAGFTHFAPSLADANDDYDADLYRKLVAVEAGNFWFVARNRLIVDAWRRFLPPVGRFLEIGCGTGFVLRGLGEAFPGLERTGTEIYTEGLSFAAERNPGATFVQLDARHLPWRDHFDAIGAFDVIEHIEEDEAVLAGMRSALVPGGGVILTVPQHGLLWSEYDEQAHHKRRYSRKDLLAKLRRAGLEPVYATSFVSLLLPAMLASRLVKRVRKGKSDAMDEFAIGRAANAALGGVMTLERALMRALRLRFPAGGSLLVIAKRAG